MATASAGRVSWDVNYHLMYSPGANPEIRGAPFFKALDDPICQDIVQKWGNHQPWEKVLEEGDSKKIVNFSTEGLRLIQCTNTQSLYIETSLGSRREYSQVTFWVEGLSDSKEVVVKGTLEETAKKIKEAESNQGFICLSDNWKNSFVCKAQDVRSYVIEVPESAVLLS